MSKPINIRPVKPIMKRFQEHDPLPTDPALLRAIARILIHHFQPTEVRRALIIRLRCLAIIEDSQHRDRFARAGFRWLMDKFGEAKREEFYAQHLPTFLTAPIPRGGHEAWVIHVQQTLLSEWLVEKKVLLQPLPKREIWLNRHRKEIKQELAVLPCLCTYPDSLPEIELNFSTPKHTLIQVLGALHGLTDNGILYRLKSPRSLTKQSRKK